MGMGSPQRTAVDVVVGGPNSALRNVPRQFWSPQTIGSASRWAGLTPVSRARSRKTARRHSIASPDQLCITREQLLDTRASRVPQHRKEAELLGTASDTAPNPHLMVKRQRSEDVDRKFTV